MHLKAIQRTFAGCLKGGLQDDSILCVNILSIVMLGNGVASAGYLEGVPGRCAHLPGTPFKHDFYDS